MTPTDRKLLVRARNLLSQLPSTLPNSLTYYALYEDIIARLDSTCSRCGGDKAPGIAMGQTWSGMPDFPGGAVVTLSPGGPGRVIKCNKCRSCGHSTYKS